MLPANTECWKTRQGKSVISEVPFWCINSTQECESIIFTETHRGPGFIQGAEENTTSMQPLVKHTQLQSLLIYIWWCNKFYWSRENIFWHNHKPGCPLALLHSPQVKRQGTKARCWRKSKCTVLRQYMYSTVFSQYSRGNKLFLGMITSTAHILENIPTLLEMSIRCHQAG